MIEECGACRNWKVVDTKAGSGLCRRYPPLPTFGAHFNQPGTGVPVVESFWPTTQAKDWCREWLDINETPTR